MADLTDSTSTPLSAPASARALALAGELSDEVSGLLADADRALLVDYPGEPAGRQPVHTVYVPADRYTADTVPTWGKEALAAVDEHPAVFEELAGDAEVVARVRAKLEREPVEDLRIDFEAATATAPTRRRTATYATPRPRSPAPSPTAPPHRSGASASRAWKHRRAPAASGR
jgi:hypothetical protein